MRTNKYKVKSYLGTNHGQVNCRQKVNCKNFFGLANHLSENQPKSFVKNILLGPDHMQVNWKHMSIGNISQLETRPLIG